MKNRILSSSQGLRISCNTTSSISQRLNSFSRCYSGTNLSWNSWMSATSICLKIFGRSLCKGSKIRPMWQTRMRLTSSREPLAARAGFWITEERAGSQWLKKRPRRETSSSKSSTTLSQSLRKSQKKPASSMNAASKISISYSSTKPTTCPKFCKTKACRSWREFSSRPSPLKLLRR